MAEVALLIDIASGMLLVTFGALVASVRPRLPGNVAFGAFSASFGVIWMLTNAAWFTPAGSALQSGLLLAATVPMGIAAFTLVAMARRFPRPMDPGHSFGRQAFLLVVGPSAAVAAAFFIEPQLALVGLDERGGVFAALFVWNMVFIVLLGALWGALFLMAFRFHVSPDETFRRQIGIASAALVLFPAYAIHPAFFRFGLYGGLIDVAGVVFLATFTVLWIRNAAVDSSGLARNISLLAFSIALAGMLADVFFPTFTIDGAPGIIRTVSVLILGYAIIRHQMLGIDVKVRWTISKSTIAAVFIAVFFIASETAQQFFGDTLGSTYVGIAAAGALVFAMAPLQRVAERIAEKAVPVAAAPSRESHDDAYAAYRVLLRRFLADGNISLEEEMALARMATSSGLTPVELLTLRRDVEAELRSPGV